MTNARKNNPEISSATTAHRTWAAWLTATFLGTGYLHPGSGTWASAITVLLWWIAAHASHSLHLSFWTAIIAAVITAIGIYSAGVVERESGQTDPGFVVIDEVAGQLIALIWIPLQWQYALASLILFRSFDIWKPPPLRKLEKLPGGWGIMLDDVAAGLYAFALLQIWQLWIRSR